MLELIANDSRCSTANPLFSQLEHPDTGQYLTPRAPLRFINNLETNEMIAGTAPSLGQHTDEVLAEVLGLSAAEIGRLHDAQIVA